MVLAFDVDLFECPGPLYELEELLFFFLALE